MLLLATEDQVPLSRARVRTGAASDHGIITVSHSLLTLTNFTLYQPLSFQSDPPRGDVLWSAGGKLAKIWGRYLGHTG